MSAKFTNFLVNSVLRHFLNAILRITEVMRNIAIMIVGLISAALAINAGRFYLINSSHDIYSYHDLKLFLNIPANYALAQALLFFLVFVILQPTLVTIFKMLLNYLYQDESKITDTTITEEKKPSD